MATPLFRMLALLAAVYVVMLAVGRGFLLDAPVVLWVWFTACVLAGSSAAARIGGLGPRRGLFGALAFLLGWLVVGPVLVRAFDYFLPDRPIILGVALASQLLVLLPGSAIAWTWRLLIPLVVDLSVSVLLDGPRPPGIGGPVTVVVTVVLVGVAEHVFASSDDEG